MRVLVTGFEPFGGSTVNPSQEIVRAINSRPASQPFGIDLHTRVLPVEAIRGPAALAAAIDELGPDAVLCLGESSRARTVTIERVFVNLADYRLPDNVGLMLTNQPIAPGGPAAYFSTLPVEAMRDAVSGDGIAVEFSLSAGAYLCNHVAYAALHRAAATKRSPAIGFVHLPRLPEQVRNDANAPSMDLATMIRAVELMIGAIVRSRQAQPC